MRGKLSAIDFYLLRGSFQLLGGFELVAPRYSKKTRNCGAKTRTRELKANYDHRSK